METGNVYAQLGSNKSSSRAQIVFNNQNSTLNCQVRNISAGGARIAVTASVQACPKNSIFTFLRKAEPTVASCAGAQATPSELNFWAATRRQRPWATERNAGRRDTTDRVEELQSENQELRRQIRELTERLASMRGKPPRRLVAKLVGLKRIGGADRPCQPSSIVILAPVICEVVREEKGGQRRELVRR